MFEHFETSSIAVNGVTINLVIKGDGPPLLLLHGYPQTHVMWHKIAPALAERYTVVAPDLRGYGDSSKPEGDDQHLTYSKRSMAADQVAVMAALGFDRFLVAGHDRGGRVTHRLCLDHPNRVIRAAVLDIIPTPEVFKRLNKLVATAYYHWFFLIQPFDLPERLIGADPIYYLHKKIGGWSSGLALFDPRALAEYARCFSDLATIHATCEDYRAAATIDLEHDAADAHAKVECPLLALWGTKGVVHRLFEPLRDWRSVARDVTGKPVPSGHFLAEEAPEETVAELLAFFRA